MGEDLDLRSVSYAVVFGALWGAVEMTAGGILHAARLPFAGILLATAGAAVLACQRSLCHVAGITLTTGCLAAGIKIFSMGGIFLFPLVAVLVEALLAEGMFCILGPSWVGAGLAGTCMGLWSLIQGLGRLALLYGTDWLNAFHSLASRWNHGWTVSPWVLALAATLLLLGLPLCGGLLGRWAAVRITGTIGREPSNA